MITVGALLLLIFTVTEISSDLDHYSIDQENASPEYFKPRILPSAFEISDVPEEENVKIRNRRETTDNSDAPVTQKPLRSRKRGRGNNRETRYQESSSPEKIPVTVIYDSEPKTQPDDNKANNATVKLKRRKQSRRPQPSNKENKTEVVTEENKLVPDITETTTEKITSTSPAPRTIVPKVFTKRPPEDNPVFKKIRQRDPVVKIIDEKNYVYAHSGNFHFSFEGGDGTKVSSQGELKSIENDKAGEAVIGSVFYKDNEGNDVSLSYTADENGYRPQGAHLPTPPPIPPAIARALKYLATATTPEPVTKPTKKKIID